MQMCSRTLKINLNWIKSWLFCVVAHLLITESKRKMSKKCLIKIFFDIAYYFDTDFYLTSSPWTNWTMWLNYSLYLCIFQLTCHLRTNNYVHSFDFIHPTQEHHFLDDIELSLNGFGLEPLSRRVGYELTL